MAVDFQTVADQMQTGDLILCAGRSSDSRDIEIVTASQFSHVAMVYRRDAGTPPMLWQEAPAALSEDQHTLTSHGGAQLGLAADTLKVMIDYEDTPYWRRLDIERSAAFEQLALQAIAQFDGRPFSTIRGMVLDWLVGHLHIDTGERTMFCAQLVAITYQCMGLLPSEPPANEYSPADFSSKHELGLLAGVLLHDEVELTLASS